MKTDCTLLIVSCESYADVLLPFSLLFKKFWPDCPFRAILVTETEPAEDYGFDETFAMGTGKNWSQRLAGALERITTPYVMMLCDDYFLSERVKTERLGIRLEQAQAFEALNLRLIPNPLPTLSFCADPPLKEYKKNTAYCIATQAGFWDRAFLLSLAERSKSIWEFERHGSFAVGGETRPLLCTPEKEFPFVDAVHKGHWERFGVDVCHKNNIDIDFSRRKLPSMPRSFIEWGKGAAYRCFGATNVVRIQNALGAGKTEDSK